MRFLFLFMCSALLSIQNPTAGGKLANTTWKVAEVQSWESMTKMYTGMKFKFVDDKKVIASHGQEKTEGTYILHPTPPDLEIIFSRTLSTTVYEAKDEFNMEYPNDSTIILKPFFRGGTGSIRLVKVK